MIRVAIVFLVVAFQTGTSRPASGSGPASSVFGVFVGSSPCDAAIRRLLQIPPAAGAEVIEWRLTLYQDQNTRAPRSYHLHVRYGLTVPNQPGLSATAKVLERKGSWRIEKGTNGNPEAVAYSLDGATSFFKVSDDVLHVLNADRTLMVGNSGWSYTLNRREAAEPRSDPSLGGAGSDEPRTISPLATGPSVFGVFEGRSPCGRIARELNIAPSAGCTKVKWRITFYHDPATRTPTVYKVESTVHRRAAREGTWTFDPGRGATSTPTVYRLAPSGTEGAILLLKGDDNVLFFLDRNYRPLAGNAGFSYTLNVYRPGASRVALPLTERRADVD